MNKKLTKEQRDEVFEYYIKNGGTIKDLGKKFNVHETAVSRILTKAFEKLQNNT